MAINTGALARALKPGVDAWFGLAYNEFPEEWSQIFDKYSSDMNFEEDVNVYGFKLGVVKPEGAAINYDAMQQGWVQRYTHIVYGLGYIITKEAIEDNLYMKLAQQRTNALAMSMRQTKENVAANVLNNAFAASGYNGADGVSLCNSAHLLSKGGTISNMPAAAADLSEASIEQGLVDIHGFVNDAGLKVSAVAKKLIVPRQLLFEAQRIMKSDLQNDSANNALNAMKSLGVLSEGVVMNHYLSSATAWFIKTNVPDGLKLFQRRDLEVQNDTEFDTENMKFKATERYSVGWSDFRAIYGSNGP